jgi:PBP1b-binding outer membrane lipoprotein LpoB
MGYKMKGSSFYGHGNSSPAKIAPLVAAVAPMIMDKMNKKKEDKAALTDEMAGKNDSKSPGKFWATAAKIAIGANKKHQANKQARDDAKQAGIQSAYGNKKL